MKNISRRVFIKGLAVAGVAAAASTVLAGCNTNMIPGVGDDAEDDTTEGVVTGNTYTYKDGDGTLAVTMDSFFTTNIASDDKEDIYFKVKVDNRLGTDKNVKFGSSFASAAATKENTQVVISGKLYTDDGIYNAMTLDATEVKNYTNLLHGTNPFGAGVISDGVLCIKGRATTGAKWTKAEFTLKFYKPVKGASKYFYLTEDQATDEYTFTVTNK